MNINNIKKSAIEHLHVVNPLFMKLCQPLHDIGISDYYFIKCHEDGTYLIYSSKKNLVELHIQTIKHQSQFFTDAVNITPNSEITFSLAGDVQHFDLKSDPALSLFWDYGFWNTFMIYKIKNNNLLEGWGFSLGMDFLDPTGFFIKNKYLLERFMEYFDVVGKELMDTSDKGKLAVYDSNFTFFNRSPEIKASDKLVNFMHQTHLNKLFIDYEDRSIHLTQRQGECLYYLAQHYTVKEIAQILQLSNRTVETYIQTVKDKIEISSRTDLLKFIQKHELAQKLALLKSV